MPLVLHEMDARFYEFKLRGKKMSRIRCDCQGCLCSEEQEALVETGRQHIERKDWKALADMLLDQCCCVRKALFPDQPPVFFQRADGNWQTEAWWCGGGNLRYQAWEAGLINGRWYCYPCLSKIVGLLELRDLRNEWVQCNQRLGKAFQEWRLRCARVLEERSNAQLAAGKKHTLKALSDAARAESRKRKAEAMVTEFTPEKDRDARVRKLAMEFTALHASAHR